jgi:hypothetical protein
MKTHITIGILAAFTLLVGCSSHHKGPAYGHEQEFRQQIADSVPVKDWGFKIRDIRFSDDYEKVLVIFTGAGTNAEHETILQDDGFRRYTGSLLTLDSPGDVKISRAFITVTLPDR